jgi:hypothetical protein
MKRYEYTFHSFNYKEKGDYMKHERWFAVKAALFIAAVCFVGCDGPYEKPEQSLGISPGAGLVQVHLDVSRTALPTIPGLSSYKLQFLKSGATSPVEKTVATTSHTEELEAGTYTLTVIGYDASSKALAEGSASVTISANTKTDVTVNLSPTQKGTGTFSYTVTLPAGFTLEYGEIRFISSASGGTNPEPLTPSAAQLSGSSSSFSAGNYVVIFKLYGWLNNTLQFAGKTLAAHIYDNLTTTVNENFETKFNSASSYELEVESPADLTTVLTRVKSSTFTDFNILVSADFDNGPIPLTDSGYSGKTISFRSKNQSSVQTITLVSDGALFTLGSASVSPTLILEDITLKGKTNNTNSLVVISGGKLVLRSGGTITGNTRSSSSSSYGGGVYVASSGSFEMNGGTISGNTAYYYGGGVYVANNGSFEMNGGTISGNTASYYNGGGVYVANNGSFEMSGGTISGNTASDYGGGVYVYSSGSFTKAPKTGSTTSGIIYGSEASDTLKNTAYSGAAVYYSSSKRRNTTVGELVSLSTANSDNWSD